MSNNNTRLLSAIGLCKKAGKLVLGFDAAAQSMRGGEVNLLALAADISPKSAKEIIRVAAECGVTHLHIGATMDDIKRLVGKRAGILAITDVGLAGSVARRAKEESA